MTLHIRTAFDNPHAQDPDHPALTMCFLPMLGTKPITEAQALIWLGNRRCSTCFPNHRSRRQRGRVAA